MQVRIFTNAYSDSLRGEKMKQVRAVALIFVLTLLISVTGVLAQDQTIADLAASDPNFSTLAELVSAAGIGDILASEGPYTVFAPTNDAFAALPASVVEYLTSHPDVLTRVLNYHVISGEVMSADASTMMAPTVEGGELSVVVDDMGVSVNGAHVVQADIDASNGVIHAIDTVLIPSFELPEVIPAILSGDVISDGSSTVEPLALAIAANFSEEGFSGQVTVGESGTGGGFRAFCEEGATDISNASRAINSSADAANPGELQKCQAIGREPVEFRVGTDALTVVVNPANDWLENATVEELALLFTAEKWSDVNPAWPAENIQRFIPGTASGTFDYFVEEVWDDDGAAILAAPNTSQNENDNVLVQGVQSSQYSLGFFGFAYYIANADTLKAVNIEGVTPSAASVDAGTYALSRPLFIYSTGQIMQEKPQVAAYVNYFLTNVNDVIDEVGYFPAPANALSLSKLSWLAATGGM
jgi:phosphate transport system substrate-binding protein